MLAFSALFLVTSLLPHETDAAYKFVRCTWTESVDGATTQNQLSMNILGNGIIASAVQGTHSRQTTLADGTFLHSFTLLSGHYAGTDSGAGHQFVTLTNGHVTDNAEGDVHERGALESLSLDMVSANGERGFSYRLLNYFSGEQQFVSASHCTFNNTKLFK